MVTSRACNPSLRAGHSDFQQAGAETDLAGDEARAAGGAALLAIPVGEQRAFLGDAVNVGRLVAHHALVVGADVPVADIVTPDDDDVGLLGRAGACAEAKIPRANPKANARCLSS